MVAIGSKEEDYASKFNEEFSPLMFHQGLYFVVVTLFTVGYGDINAEDDLSKISTMLLILITLGIMP